MKSAILEKTTEYIGDSAKMAARAASAVAEGVDDGVGVAKRAVRRGRNAAEDIVGSTARQIRRNPLLATLTALTVGVGVGVLIGRIGRRN
jgi:ElaB/YqjD/DUF883 family membrane-anchored ribosome-binding protein